MAYKKEKIIADSDKKKVEVDTKKEDEIKAKIEAEKTLVVNAKKLVSAALASRRRYDWEWLVRNLYLRGYHFARYNRTSSTFVLGTKTNVRIPINLMWAQARSIRNQVTSFRPKWEVLPAKPTEASIENAVYSGKLLDYLYEKLNLKRKLKEVIYHGLYTSIGIWQFDWNSTREGKEGQVEVSVVDPFDWGIDPSATSLDDAQFVFKSVRKALKEVKADPRYENTEGLKADSRLASSEYKSFLLQAVKNIGEGESSLNDENEYTIITELQKLEYDDKGSPKVRILTFANDSELPIRNELTKRDYFNYEIFQADLQPLEIYGESWAKQVMPINRVLDALESHVFEYNHFFAKGRFVIDKGSGVRSVVNEHGHIIEKNPGFTVTNLPIAPLPMATFQQITNMRQYQEDISGIHEVTLGRLPTGVKSGVGIAELRQADATAQDDLVDALEDFLVRSAKQIFKLAAEHYTSTKLAKVIGRGGQTEYFYVLGEKSPNAKNATKKKTFGDMQLPIAIIGLDNEVRVTIGSWLAYTKQARQEQLKELFRLGAIDQKTLLENLEFGDVEAISDRTRTERLIQLRQQSPHSQELVNERQGVDEESLALAENELMDGGTSEPVEIEDDHEVHLAIHKEGLMKTKNPTLYLDHMSEHIKLMERAPTSGAATAAMTQVAMMGGEGGLPPEMGGAQPGMPEGVPMPPTQAGPGMGGAMPTPGLTTGE